MSYILLNQNLLLEFSFAIIELEVRLIFQLDIPEASYRFF